MTAIARVQQADIERTLKAAKNAGWASVRVTVDLVNQKIDLTASAVGDGARSENSWDREII